MNEEIYKGTIINSERTGYGKLYIQSKLKYEGNWKNNLYHGHGTLYYDNGSIEFEGDWNMGKSTSKGKKYYKDGSLLYEGLANYNIEDSLLFEKQINSQPNDINLLTENINDMFDNIQKKTSNKPDEKNIYTQAELILNEMESNSDSYSEETVKNILEEEDQYEDRTNNSLNNNNPFDNDNPLDDTNPDNDNYLDDEINNKDIYKPLIKKQDNTTETLWSYIKKKIYNCCIFLQNMFKFW